MTTCRVIDVIEDGSPVVTDPTLGDVIMTLRDLIGGERSPSLVVVCDHARALQALDFDGRVSSYYKTHFYGNADDL